MKRYEIRSADEKTVIVSSTSEAIEQEGTVSHWFSWWKNDGSVPEDSVLGIYEWETEAEADKARLDWLDTVMDAGGRITVHNSGLSIRAYCDAERPVPKPTFTVIERSK